MSEVRVMHVSSMSELAAALPKQYSALLQFSRDVMEAPSDLSHIEREQIGLLVSSLNGSRYCVAEQRNVLREMHVPDADIRALISGSLDVLDDKIQVLFEYIVKLTLGMEWIKTRDIETVYRAGWSKKALKDAVCIGSLFSQLNGLATGFGLDEKFKANELDVKADGEQSDNRVVDLKFKSSAAA